MTDTRDQATETSSLEQDLDKAAASITIQANQLQELVRDPGAAGGESMGLDHLLDVPVRITVEVGRTRLKLGELVRMSAGSLIALDREAHEPADILVNGKIVARGEIVTIDEHYGVRITHVS